MPRGRRMKSEDALLKSAEMIGWALGGLEREIAQTRERLAALTAHAAKLRQQLGPQLSRVAASAVGTAGEDEPNRASRRGRMSAEARKRISEMMRKRWAERKKKGLKRL